MIEITNQKKIKEIVNYYKNIFEEQYLFDFARAIYLSKMGQNNLSRKTIERNKPIEKEIGKLYFISSIRDMNLENYAFSKKFIGENFDIYKPLKVNLGKRLIFDGDYLDVIEGELEVVSDSDSIRRLETLEKTLKNKPRKIILRKNKNK